MQIIALLLSCSVAAQMGGGHNDTDHDDSVSAGSCYDMAAGHTVTCDVMEAMCTSPSMWYSPGYVGGSGCCHCAASCDHAAETGADCEAQYNDAADGDHDIPGHGDGDHDMPGGDHGGGHDGHDHGGGGHGDHGGATDAVCESNPPLFYLAAPIPPCQALGAYPLYCTQALAEAASPTDGWHFYKTYYMPNGVSPLCHGNYVGDATQCDCPESDAARAVSGAAAAYALAALLL